MIVLYVLLPFFILLLLTFVQTIFAKKLIQKRLGNASFVHIENLSGFCSYLGLKVHLPSTPPGQLEAYLLDDWMMITGKTKVLGVFHTQKKPLILFRPSFKPATNQLKIQTITDYKVYDFRIRLNFNYQGVSKVQYTLGMSRSMPKEEREYLKNWFNHTES